MHLASSTVAAQTAPVKQQWRRGENPPFSIGVCLHWGLGIKKQTFEKQPLRGETKICKYGINIEIIISNDTYFPIFELKVQKENDRKQPLCLPSMRVHPTANQNAATA